MNFEELKFLKDNEDSIPLSNKKIQVRAIESDLKMVQQTIKLLSEGGVRAVTLEAVGVNAGYSRGLVSRRYGSKDQLLIRVLNYLENWLNEKSKLATQNKYGLEAINSLIRLCCTNLSLKAYSTI